MRVMFCLCLGEAAVEIYRRCDDTGAVHPQGSRVAARPQDRLGRPRGGRGSPTQEQPLQAQRESLLPSRFSSSARFFISAALLSCTHR